MRQGGSTKKVISSASNWLHLVATVDEDKQGDKARFRRLAGQEHKADRKSSQIHAIRDTQYTIRDTNSRHIINNQAALAAGWTKAGFYDKACFKNRTSREHYADFLCALCALSVANSYVLCLFTMCVFRPFFSKK